MNPTVKTSPFELRLCYGMPYYSEDDIRFKALTLKYVYFTFDHKGVTFFNSNQ